MYWGQFKDSVFHMCLSGTVVASSSLTQGLVGLNPFYCNDNVFSDSSTTASNYIFHLRRVVSTSMPNVAVMQKSAYYLDMFCNEKNNLVFHSVTSYLRLILMKRQESVIHLKFSPAHQSHIK